MLGRRYHTGAEGVLGAGPTDAGPVAAMDTAKSGGRRLEGQRLESDEVEDVCANDGGIAAAGRVSVGRGHVADGTSGKSGVWLAYLASTRCTAVERRFQLSCCSATACRPRLVIW